jgi:hypothetical protein
MYPTDPRVSPAQREEFFDLTWEIFGELSRALAMKVARDFQPEVVIGIARAGVIPAAIIASILRVDLYAMTISRRAGTEAVRERPEVLTAAPRQAEGKRVLLVDELATSGDTMRLALAAVRGIGPAEIRTATSFSRPGGYSPDYVALQTDQTIVFPWDRKVYEDEKLVVNPRYLGIVDA